jgi:hypothetical protein
MPLPERATHAGITTVTDVGGLQEVEHVVYPRAIPWDTDA